MRDIEDGYAHMRLSLWNKTVKQSTIQPEILAVIKFGSLATNDVISNIGRFKIWWCCHNIVYIHVVAAVYLKSIPPNCQIFRLLLIYVQTVRRTSVERSNVGLAHACPHSI